MKFKCPNCGSPVDASSIGDGERIECARCRKRLKLPRMDASMEMRFDPEAAEVDAAPEPAGAETLPPPVPPPYYMQPTAVPYPVPPYPHPPGAMQAAPAAPQVMVVPVPVAHEPEELVQERIEDLRESRSARKERRGHYNLDRDGNPVGMAGFAMASTALALALSGWLFLKQLPIYTLFTVGVGLPLSIAALACGIVGCLRPGGNKLFASVAAAGGGLLFVLIFPALMLGLQQRWS